MLTRTQLLTNPRLKLTISSLVALSLVAVQENLAEAGHGQSKPRNPPAQHTKQPSIRMQVREQDEKVEKLAWLLGKHERAQKLRKEFEGSISRLKKAIGEVSLLLEGVEGVSQPVDIGAPVTEKFPESHSTIVTSLARAKENLASSESELAEIVRDIEVLTTQIETQAQELGLSYEQALKLAGIC